MKVTVKDADIKVADSVRNELVERGELLDFTRMCPVAQAIKRERSGKVEDVAVLQWRSRLRIQDRDRNFRNSKPMQKFIRDWDEGLPVEPGTFILKETY